MNNLHIAIVHDTPIPAIKYGGTERIVWWLGKALVKLGHRVTYLVPAPSTIDFANMLTRPAVPHSIKALLPKDVNIVHSFATLNEDLDKPLITTIEGNGQVGERFHPNTVFVSRDHARRHGSEIFVYNGLDPDDYPGFSSAMKEPFCYFLAKARWKVKNVKGAIHVAKGAGFPLKIMGGWRPSFNRNVEWLGMLGKEKKNDILEKGSALLFPVRWHEPFGIAIIEALLTGSPVFGTPYGSLPEIVSEEYGYLSNDSVTLMKALREYKSYSKETCRSYVLQKFTHMHMAENYLNLYEHVISGKILSKSEPKTLSNIDPESLLEFL